MSYRTVLSIAAAAILGIACVSTDALAYRAVHRGGGVHVGGVYRGGVYRGGAYRGGAYRGGYVRRGVGVGAPYLYNRAACGYYPYPPCY
jgi:hypothetical protein